MVGSRHRLCLQVSLDGRHRADDGLGVLADPAVVDEPDRDRVEVVPLLATVPPRRDEIRFLKDVQVPHDPEAGHRRQVGAQLSERLAIALEQPIEKEPPARVAKRPKRRCHRIVVHDRDYM